MSGATTYCVIYNGGLHSQVYDEEGHSIDPGMWVCARRSFVRDMIDDGRLVVVDPETITSDSVPAARLARETMDRLNDEIDAEKKQEAAKPVKKVSASESRTN